MIENNNNSSNAPLMPGGIKRARRTALSGCRDGSGIDFVLPWVDGSDPEWRQELSLYSQGRAKSAGSQDDEGARYRDWGLLRYWFRGVERFAPWVRRVHFVTWGHVPGWLNLAHPKLNLVRHEDYIPRKYLPTFSSHVIELNLHRIEGLSERFVYFNDDTFLLRPVQEGDFFKGGLPRAFARMDPGGVTKNEWFYAPLNNVAVINDHFKKDAVLGHLGKWFSPRYGIDSLKNLFMLLFSGFYGFASLHLPNSYLKSTFKAVWEEEGGILDTTCRNRFRSCTDVNQWLIKDWQLVSGAFSPRGKEFGKVFYLSDRSEGYLDSLCSYIDRQKGKVVCVNDYAMPEEGAEAIMERVARCFDVILPEKSEFEV